MMTCKVVSSKMDNHYYQSDDYYAQSLNNQDCFLGKLSKTLSKIKDFNDQYNVVKKYVAEDLTHEKRIALDCCFSAPKSVSLLLAQDEKTRNLIVDLHNRAVEKALERIEKKYIIARVKNKTMITGNALFSKHQHFLSRNEELDLHSHCLLYNFTEFNNQSYSIDYGRLQKHQKEIGTAYRAELADLLQKNGYALQITDWKKGFFEVEGFNREAIEKYSTRRAEIVNYLSENGLKPTTENSMAANLATRKAKKTSNFEEILEKTHKILYEDLKIEPVRKIKEENKNETNKNNIGRNHEYNSRKTGGPSLNDSATNERSSLESFTARNSLSDLRQCQLDAAEDGIDVLLPSFALRKLARQQTDRNRNTALQQSLAAKRRYEVERIAKKAIEDLSAEKFAFSVPELRERIINYNILNNVSQEEAQKLIEKNRLVKLGRMERDGVKNKDVFLTTEKNLRKEQYILSAAKRKEYSGLTSERAEAIISTIKTEKNLAPSKEQCTAIKHILCNHNNIVCIQGLAGTGKTYTCNVLREACKKEGITIAGACYTGKAAAGLQAESGIKSQTIHSFFNNIEKQYNPCLEIAYKAGEVKQEWDFSQIPKAEKKEILLIDEAGLVDNNLMFQVLKYQQARGVNCQVVLQGDYSQLPPIGAGEPFRQMIANGAATCFLSDIRRQKNIELLKTVKESVNGDHLKVFESLKAKNSYIEIKNNDERFAAITAKMTESKIDEYHNTLLLVTTNSARRRYNKLIRNEYCKKGELDKGVKIEVITGEDTMGAPISEKINLAKKDRIIFLQNDNKIGVKNGEMGAVESIKNDYICVRLDDGRTVSFNLKNYNHIDYAYSTTNYKAQGLSVDNVVCDMTVIGKPQARNDLYVDLSRARYSATVYTDNKAKLEKETKEFCHKITSSDFLAKITSMQNGAKISGNDLYSIPKTQQSTIKPIVFSPDPPPYVLAAQEAVRQQQELKPLKPLAAPAPTIPKEKPKTSIIPPIPKITKESEPQSPEDLRKQRDKLRKELTAAEVSLKIETSKKRPNVAKIAKLREKADGLRAKIAKITEKLEKQQQSSSPEKSAEASKSLLPSLKTTAKAPILHVRPKRDAVKDAYSHSKQLAKWEREEKLINMHQ